MDASGLIFTAAQVAAAQQHRQSAPFAAAWDAFRLVAASDPVARVTHDALTWRLAGEDTAAERAAAGLDALDALDARLPTIDMARRVFALCQALACLGDHPALSASRRARGEDVLMAAWDVLDVREGGIHEGAWRALAALVTGLVTGRAELREAGADVYRGLVDMILPHGYVKPLVESKDDESLARTVQFVHGMTLMAEAGEHAGLGLWDYEHRRVSVLTAALYPLYYYYYPEKWPWKANSPFELGRKSTRRERARFTESAGEDVLQPAQAIFQQHAAFLELVNRRTAASVHAVTIILDELRPITDLLGGGPVTLTHTPPPQPKRRGLFGR